MSLKIRQLENFHRSIESVIVTLATAIDQLELLAEAMPAPRYSPQTDEPLNRAAEFQAVCRSVAAEELAEAKSRLSQVLTSQRPL